MLLTVLSLEADGAADGLGAAVVAADGLADAAPLGGCGAVDGLTGTISADTTPLGALLDRSSLGGRERERGAGAGMSGSIMAGTLSTLPVFCLGGPPYTSDLFGAALTGP